MKCRRLFKAPPGSGSRTKIVRRKTAPAAAVEGPDFSDVPPPREKGIIKTTPIRTGTLLFSILGVGLLVVGIMVIVNQFQTEPPEDEDKSLYGLRAGARNVDPDVGPTKDRNRTGSTDPEPPPDEPEPPGRTNTTDPDVPEFPLGPRTALAWPVGPISANEAYERFRDGIVRIATEWGTGTGWIIHPRGIVVTDNHVVAGASQITVGFYSGKEVMGMMLASYPGDDLALLQLPADTYRPLPVCWSHRPVSTAKVAVLGYATSTDTPLKNAMTTAKGTVKKISTTPSLGEIIWTTSRITGGNVGAPLFDLGEGGVVGVVAAKHPDLVTREFSAAAVPMWRFPTLDVPEMRDEIELIAGRRMEWYTPRGGAKRRPDPKPVEIPLVYSDAKSKADAFESDGRFGDALEILDRYMLGGLATLRRRDSKQADKIKSEIKAFQARLREKSETQWSAIEKELEGSGRTLAALMAVQDRINGLAPKHQRKVAESFLTILDSLILSYVAQARDRMPTEAPRLDLIVMKSGGKMEGRIVDKSAGHVTLQLKSGKMRIAREQIESIKPGNIEEIQAGRTQAKVALQNAMALAYTNTLRASFRARIDKLGGIELTAEGGVGELCDTCYGSGSEECEPCGARGFSVTDCRVCRNKKKSSCPYCNDARIVRHTGAGVLTLKSKPSKGQQCPTCGGDGVNIRVPCKRCSGTGKIGVVEKEVSLELLACDKAGNSITAFGKGKPCKKKYAKLKRTFAAWDRSLTISEKIDQVNNPWGISGREALITKVRETYMRIEEYAICDEGNIPCLECRTACSRCEGGEIRSKCDTCAGSGNQPCSQCAGLGTSMKIHAVLSRVAPETAARHQRKLLSQIGSE